MHLRRNILSVAIVSLQLAPLVARADGSLDKDNALALWALVTWGSENCAGVSIPPMASLVANQIEATAPKSALAHARDTVPRTFISKSGGIEQACDEIGKMGR